MWLSSEPSPKSLQIVWNIAGWKLFAVYVNQTNLNVKFSTKMGAKQEASQNPGGTWPNQAPFRTAIDNTRTKHNQLPAIIWNFYHDAKKLLQADDCIMIRSNYIDSLVKRKLFACVVSERVRLKGNIGRICFYPPTRYFQVIHSR